MNDSLRAALPLLIFALAFVLLIVLPARARNRMQQQTRNMQESLTIGTEVMMTSGLYGRVAALQEDTVDIEVAPGVVMRFARAAVGTVSPGGGATDGEHSDTVESNALDSGSNEGSADQGHPKE